VISKEFTVVASSKLANPALMSASAESPKSAIKALIFGKNGWSLQ